MKKYIRYISLFSLLLFVFATEYQSKKDQIESELIKVRKAFQANEIEKGILPLQKVIQMDTILPNEVAFFTGVSLYHYEHKPQSEKAILRYLKLTDSTGGYYQESIELLTKLWSDQKIDTCNLCVNYQALSSFLDCDKCLKEDLALQKLIEEDCLENGMSLCEICKGEGIIIRTGALGNLVYQTCHKCHGEGYVPCPHLEKK